VLETSTFAVKAVVTPFEAVAIKLPAHESPRRTIARLSSFIDIDPGDIEPEPATEAKPGVSPPANVHESGPLYTLRPSTFTFVEGVDVMVKTPPEITEPVPKPSTAPLTATSFTAKPPSGY
jgi:hypothetical protein